MVMEMKINKVALIGLGGIGAFVATRLQTLLGDDNFFVIADGSRKQRLEQGILINGTRYKFRVVSSDVREMVDLVIFATKNMHLEAALHDIRYKVDSHTVAMSLLNGIDSEDHIKAAYPMMHVIKSLIKVPATNRDGNIVVPMETGKISFGEDKNMVTAPVKAVEELFIKANIPYDIPEDMKRAMWQKFMYNVSENQISAVLGVTYGEFQKQSYAETLRQEVCREVIAIAQCKNVDINEQDIQTRARYMKNLPSGGKTSTL